MNPRQGRGLFARAAMLLPLLAAGLVPAAPAAAEPPTPTPSTCQFLAPSGQPSSIAHVIHIQFDNVHFTRDNPNVPSDLEQMPHLLNFIKSNGTLLANEHTPLIAHTSDDLITGLTGVYGDHHGIPVGNSFEVYNASDLGSYNTSAFTYWTDTVAPDPANPGRKLPPQMLESTNKTLPAPWVPFVEAGCNVGVVSDVNMVLENNGNDINQVFGASSPEASESASDRTNDFVGIAVHCGDNTCSTVGSGVPATGSRARPELGGQGSAALYGHKYIATQVSPITQTDGTPITGFNQANGFNPTPMYTLGYMASLLKAGVPVVYGYVADAHDSRVSCAPTSSASPVVSDTLNGHPCGAFAPGEAGYVQQLRAWDTGFDQFFQELNGMGITAQNTLFVIHADENDHYTGSAPKNPNCDGVTTPCEYDRTKIGEVTTDLPLLLKQQNLYDFGMSGGSGATPGTVRSGFANTNLAYSIDVDTAPGFWLKGHPDNGSPQQRTLETALGKVTASNPYTGSTEQLFRFLVDEPGLNALHMVTADDDRTPDVVGFGAEDHFIQTSPLMSGTGTSTCDSFPSATDTTCLSNGFIWLHGNFATDVDTTWAALIGPGVAQHGVDSTTWVDHTDLRPTLMTLVCLKDAYAYQGRAILEDLNDSALPRNVAAARGPLTALGQRYKQLNAPVGDFGVQAIETNTEAIRGDAATYQRLETRLKAQVAARDGAVNAIQNELDRIPGCGGGGTSTPGAGRDGPAIDAGNLDGLRRAAEDLITASTSNQP
ncbi:MAG: hypothetical protein JO023_17915 [Chloroflexi bacterium]|nr:hypothetical protein [Chloroflexota bacterium]